LAAASGSAAEAAAAARKEFEAKFEKARKDHLKALADCEKDFKVGRCRLTLSNPR
jgi:hypothetical protein